MVPLALFGTFGPGELLLILAILVLLFGAKKIPDLARGLGEGIRNFRTGLREEKKPEQEERREVPEGTEK